MGEQIKVHYTTRDGGQSVAYVDDETGIGSSKHSDIAVILEFRPDGWVQVDDWEWEWRDYDDFYRVGDGKRTWEVEQEALAAARKGGRLMGLFEDLGLDPNDPEVQEIQRDLDEHWKFRPCPEGCGCTESYDDRHLEKSDGGFGPAGCPCPRCTKEVAP